MNKKHNKITKKRFNLKFTSEELQTGSRKNDSNYYKRRISSKKIAYIHSLIKNLDQLIIISSFVLPEIKTGLIDRFLILALRFEVEPVIIFSKSDLVSQSIITYFTELYEAVGFKVIIISNPQKKGIESVKTVLTDRQSALVGHSGVGKTTMLNNLDKNYQEKTQTISEFTKRGRHTTTRIVMHELSFGGLVFDMPGLKEMDFIDLTRNDLKKYYLEFHPHQKQCLYKNCSHSHEPDCQVKLAVKEEVISLERYQNYLNILNDLPE